mmetsp:Transcript_94728/g.295090  ORF Transcript_94728/g.295090 Transcript_94728/m.295090 type:complete len:139 (-) Transcript_94728:623-1039(-)
MYKSISNPSRPFQYDRPRGRHLRFLFGTLKLEQQQSLVRPLPYPSGGLTRTAGVRARPPSPLPLPVCERWEDCDLARELVREAFGVLRVDEAREEREALEEARYGREDLEAVLEPSFLYIVPALFLFLFLPSPELPGA